MATEAGSFIKNQENQINTDEESSCQAVFAIEGMTCASCSMRVEKGLKKVPGVLDAQVNLATERATVTYQPTATDLQQMVQKVEKVGYKAIPLDQPAQPSSLPSANVQTEKRVASSTSEAARQEEDRSQRKQVELKHKRNLLILSVGLSLP